MSMYIFARRRRVNPAQGRAAVAMAAEAATRASEMTGLAISLWTPIFSADIGTMVWTTGAEHLADLEAADATLTASDEWSDWVEQNDSLFTGPLDDSVLQIVHGTRSDPPAAYVQVGQGVCANGAFSEAMAFGVEIADVASRLSGLPTMFGAGLTGPYGAVAWITEASDLAAVEAGNAALATQDEWSKLVDRAGHAFQPGVVATLYRRLN
jgi:hypothetical protein